MYAIVETGGKQYKVSPGETVRVDKLDFENNTDITLDKVIMVSKDDKAIFGSPYISGAKVLASVEDTRKGRKMVIFKKRPRKNYRRLRGHRQTYSALKIKEIVLGG
jgi:large subunit ribosomal protein L21